MLRKPAQQPFPPLVDVESCPELRGEVGWQVGKEALLPHPSPQDSQTAREQDSI